MLRIDNIKIYEDLSEEELVNKISKKYKINDMEDFSIVKKSIDARDKENVHYNYAVNIKVKDESKYPNIKKVEEKQLPTIKHNRNSKYQPIIIGAGPAGLFCALTLIDNGYKPIIIEQGSPVEERISIVEEYKKKAKINTKCNVQFGEGGAGTFSDGKLTTGISSPYIKLVLDNFYNFGAPKEITYLSHPHIGTDNLVNILISSVGTIILTLGRGFNFIETIGFATGSSIGYLLAMLLISEGERKIRHDLVPENFRGLPITLIYISVLALAIYGLTGNTMVL